MLVIASCCLLLALAVLAVIRWGSLPVAASPAAPHGARAWAGAAAWTGFVALAAGVGAGILAGGAGARIAMRVLALTSPGSEFMQTEGGALIGVVTLEGTLELISFAGIFLGGVTGVLYVLSCRWLPRGRWGGIAFGLLLLVVAGTRMEPLRADNIDFVLLGPPWLAVTTFATVVVLHGMAVAALAGRLSRARPLPWLARAADRKRLSAGTIAVAGVLLLAAPSFAGSVADILRAA